MENASVTLGDHKVHVRIYTPKGAGPFPVILYVHGGGWVIADLDTYDASKIAVVGESAGGNMAAAVSMMAKEQGVQSPEYQVLVYPVSDVSKMDTQFHFPIRPPPYGRTMT